MYKLYSILNRNGGMNVNAENPKYQVMYFDNLQRYERFRKEHEL